MGFRLLGLVKRGNYEIESLRGLVWSVMRRKLRLGPFIGFRSLHSEDTAIQGSFPTSYF